MAYWYPPLCAYFRLSLFNQLMLRTLTSCDYIYSVSAILVIFIPELLINLTVLFSIFYLLLDAKRLFLKQNWTNIDSILFQAVALSSRQYIDVKWSLGIVQGLSKISAMWDWHKLRYYGEGMESPPPQATQKILGANILKRLNSHRNIFLIFVYIFLGYSLTWLI